ncbi:MAG: SURF1 family protein [Hyphomicrobiaceae bacterium]
MTRRPRTLFWPTLMTVLGALFLVGLGTWQLDRKAWKEALLQRIEERAKAEPIVLDAAASLFKSGDDLEYTRVRARGRLLTERSRFLFQAQGMAAGYHVYTPLETPSGATLLVNRGFVPEAQLSTIDTSPADRNRIVDIVGLLRRPGHKGWFDGQNDPAKNRWYWRDLDGMAKASFPDGRREIYPFFLDIEASAAPRAASYPQPGVTRVQLSNKHLQYAMTWYGLALTLIGVYLLYIRSNKTPGGTFREHLGHG